MKLVVLASGRGSNFASIAEAVNNGTIPNSEILALVSNKPTAPALELAKSLGIPTHIVSSKSYKTDGVFHRDKYEVELGKVLKKLSPDFICLAGYMLILGRDLVEQWPNKMINIHPSILPSFRGLKAQKQAIDAGVLWTGCTVHLVNAELDDGPILAQTIIAIEPEDSFETLEKRLLPLEHKTYVETLRKLATQKFEILGRRVIWKT